MLCVSVPCSAPYCQAPHVSESVSKRKNNIEVHNQRHNTLHEHGRALVYNPFACTLIRCTCRCRCTCTCMCICRCVCVSVSVSVHSVILKVVRVRQKCWDWKDGERTVRRAKSGETLVEASRDCKSFVILVSCGTKDKPNHLTAGSLRSFPQDNYSFIRQSE